DRSANRIFLRPAEPRHTFINYDHSRSVEHVLVGELTPLQERDTYRSEVVWASDAVVRARHVPGFGRRLTLNLEALASASFKGELSNGAYGHDARNRADMFIDVLAEARQSGWPSVD